MTAPPADTTPPCPHFGVCGGCQLQHLTYSAQIERKAAHLRQLLGSFTLPDLQLHPSPPLAYRNRIRLTLRQIDGRLRAGYLGKSRANGKDEEAVIPTEAALDESGEAEGPPHLGFSDLTFVPITQCPIAAPLLWRAAQAFLTLTDDTAWLHTPALTPDQLELFTTPDESKLQLTLYLRTAQKNPPARLATDFAALCESLRAQLPQLAGAAIVLLPPAARTRRTEQPRPGPAWGSPGINYTVAVPPTACATNDEQRTTKNEQLTYWVPRGAFFQVNRFLIPELVALAARIAQTTLTSAATSDTGPLAWDLYAGVGLFSRVLARTFAEATAVEVAEPAATALAQTRLPNLRPVKAITLDFLRAAVLQRDRPSLIVLDPPRAGLGDEVCSLLARIAAPTLVYVSCSPQALAQDLAILTASGYSIAEVHLFDLFPQTRHIETVAVLRRA